MEQNTANVELTARIIIYKCLNLIFNMLRQVSELKFSKNHRSLLCIIVNMLLVNFLKDR